MKLEKIKKEIMAYRDFYGGDLIGIDQVQEAKTKEELGKLLYEHEQHMEMMLSDAIYHLNNFKKRIGL